MADTIRPRNHLANETSLYLRQHVHNPVDWHPWGPEALVKARELNRPIFLSVGYSACHWCHVMEHESFENAGTAQIMNDQFVCIKVDREERPDLDQIYMLAVQLLAGQGGWPMSVFLTPEQKPFYGGTYYPPHDHYGRPGFPRVLESVAGAWKTRREDLSNQAEQITGHIRELGRACPEPVELEPELIRNAVRSLARSFDSVHGGFGSAPKFPHATDVRLLLRAWKRFSDDSALNMAQLTLDRMAQGGIYDQLGGGFHRYSTDARWLVPHFEKMLYDNGLLVGAYLDGFQATKNTAYAEVVNQTLGYIQREMTNPDGAFFSAQDADTEGEEGRFFVWSQQEIDAILGPEIGDLFSEAYGVSPEGNWEHHNILHQARSVAQLAKLRNLPESEISGKLESAKQRLFEKRRQRSHPGRDEKVLTSWNALMIDAFAQASQVLGQPEFARAAARAADFLWSRMQRNGRLLRTYTVGSEPKLNAYLEDYAFFANALVTLHEATSERVWIDRAQELCRVIVDQFDDADQGGYFFTSRDHEPLIGRLKDVQDSSMPSGTGMAVTAMARLAKHLPDSDFRVRAGKTLRACSGLMAESPMATAQLLIAFEEDLD